MTQNSYRKITISSIVEKIVEKEHVHSVTDMLNKVKKSFLKMMYRGKAVGFGKLLHTTIVADKAFDVVWYDSILVSFLAVF